MGVPRRIGTRRPESEDEVVFDWTKPAQASQAFGGARAVYIVAPIHSSDHGAIVPPILEEAQRRGVARFVLLSASSLEAGGPMMGRIHAWLAANATEWAVLRPSWFMQNFSEQQHLPTIRDEGLIYSATGDGRVGFIDAVDIARVAAVALTTDIAWNRDIILTGPEALSYVDVAARLTTAVGRDVRHIDLTADALAERYQRHGLDADYANMLAAMDLPISRGSEDRVTDGVRWATGTPPTGLDEFIRREYACWSPSHRNNHPAG